MTTEQRPEHPLAPMEWAQEQRLLGVGVRVARSSARQRVHEPAVAAHCAALLRGFAGEADEIVAERLAALRRRMWRAPGWVARLHALSGAPDDLGTLDDLRDFPLCDRDGYAASWRDLFDRDGDAELHLATSSGSTGQALLVPRSGYDGVHMWAVLRFWVARLGVTLPPRPRVVLLDALPGGLEYSTRAPLFFGGALHRISTIRPRAAERLRFAHPAVLSSDPAGLDWLVQHAAAPPLQTGLVISSAQQLMPSLRAAVAAAIDAPLVNYYAATEIGPIAWECLRAPGRFHALHPDVWVEAVDGALAVTRLRDSPLPLLRYLTGDRGEVTDEVCACGFHGRSILGLLGRHPALFVTAGGREVDAWALSWLFKDLPLVRYELAQLAGVAERFELRVGPGAPPVLVDGALLAVRVARALVRLGFTRPEVVFVAEAPPAGAKPRPFVRRD